MAQTPFWLEIKTEYIDANLDKVIEYLSKESANPQHDSFYEETVSLLRTRIKELLDTLSRRAIWESDETADKAAGISVLRMLGSYLLVDGPSGKMVRDAFFFFTKTLASVLPGNYMEDLAEVAVRSLVFQPERFGFSWQDIKEVQAEVMAHKFLASVALSAKPAPEAWYQNKGSICIKDGAVNLYTGNKEEVAFARTNASLPLFDDLLKVQSANDRIQQKDEDNLDVMEKFTKDYIREMGKSKPAPVHSLKRYLTGDTVPVRFTGVDTSGNLLVETAEGGARIVMLQDFAVEHDLRRILLSQSGFKLLLSFNTFYNNFTADFKQHGNHIFKKDFCILSEQVAIRYISSEDIFKLVILYNLSKAIFFIISFVVISQT